MTPEEYVTEGRPVEHGTKRSNRVNRRLENKTQEHNPRRRATWAATQGKPPLWR